MDLKGFESINRAFAAADVEATVTPMPAEGEDVRFVTVETDDTVQPSRVLNALQNANLMYFGGTSDLAMNYSPELIPLGVQPGSVTLEDKNDANRSVWS